MSKELDKLIEQVLAEKLPLDVKIPDELDKDFLDTYLKTDPIKMKTSTTPRNSMAKKYHALLLRLAKETPDEDKIDLGDFEKLFAKGVGPKKVRDNMVASGTTNNISPAKLVDAWQPTILRAFEKWLADSLTTLSTNAAPLIASANALRALENWKENHIWTPVGATTNALSKKEVALMKKYLRLATNTIQNAEADYWTAERFRENFETNQDSAEWKSAFKMTTSPNQRVRNVGVQQLMTWLESNSTEGTWDALENPQVAKAVQRMVGSRPEAGQEDYFSPFGTDKTPDLSLEPELSQGERDQQESVRNWQVGQPFLTTANKSLVSTFSAVAGSDSSITAVLGEVAAFAEAVSGGKNAIKAWIENRGPTGEIDYINFARVVSILADEARGASAIDAGGKFEQWLALLMNIPVVGAEQGSADNMGKLVGGQPVITSAKLYSSICGDHPPSQSTKGFAEQEGFQNPGDKMYYFVGHKIKGEVEGPDARQLKTISGKSRTFTDINFYLIELQKQNDNRIFGRLLKNDMQKSKQYLCQYKAQEEEETEDTEEITEAADPDSSQAQTLLFPCGPQGGWSEADIAEWAFMKIPVWDKDLQQAFQNDRLVLTTADFLAEQVKGEGWAALTNAIIKSYKDIQRVEASTTVYYGAKTKGVSDATTYIDDVATKVQKMRDQLNFVFHLAGETDTAAEEQPEEIVESKSPLDQLIEAIVKQTLIK